MQMTLEPLRLFDLLNSDCLQSDRVKLERVRYFPRQLLTAEDMTLDQEYFQNKMRRHNRLLHGWGVVCGFEVTASPTGAAPWRVAIHPGYALGPSGDEIYMAEVHHLDLARCGPSTATDPCEPDLLRRPGSITRGPRYVAIKYATCLTRPVRAMPSDCGCEEVACEHSRIRDSFEIGCLTELPSSHEIPLICDLIKQKKLTPCPPCEEEPWVVLAQVNLARSPETKLTDQMIDNIKVRRQIYSTAMLQEQLIHCCCGRQSEPVPDPGRPMPGPIKHVPARVTSIDPNDNAVIIVYETPTPRNIVVKFDKKLQEETVNDKTVMVIGKDDQGKSIRSAVTSIKVVYDDNNQTATLSGIFKSGRYEVTVRGNSPNRIMDIHGLALDGNSDPKHTPGGNFTSRFTIAVNPP